MPHWKDLLDPHAPDGAYLSWKKVEPRVGISRTTAWRLTQTGDFPSPYVISPGRVAYREQEIEAWKLSRAHRGETPYRLPGRVAAAGPSPEPASWTAASKPQPPPTSEPPAAASSSASPRARPPKPQMTFDF